MNVLYERRAGLEQALKAMVSAIHDAQTILVTMHCRPDGDAFGSAVAAFHILSAIGKDVVVFNVDDMPQSFAFLEGSEVVVSTLPENVDFDLCLVLDCAEPRLLGKAFPFEKLNCPFAYIDHHSVVWEDCLVNLHDSKASAAGELLFHLMVELGVELDQKIAAALYTAIITDTGSFRYRSTTADAMHICGELLATGIDVWEIASQIYENNPAEKVQLLGDVLQTLWISEDGRLSSLHATRDILRRWRCSGAMTDGFINYARSISGVEVSIFLTQLEGKLYRLSFRSRGHLDVSLIAARFGGGGHKNAAACTIEGDIDSIRKLVEEILNETWKT